MTPLPKRRKTRRGSQRTIVMTVAMTKALSALWILMLAIELIKCQFMGEKITSTLGNLRIKNLKKEFSEKEFNRLDRVVKKDLYGSLTNDVHGFELKVNKKQRKFSKNKRTPKKKHHSSDPV